MKSLVVDYGIIYNRLAVLDNKKLVELIIENKSNKSLVGNVYLGRVCNVIKSISAAFVDIGLSKNAYLPLTESIKNGSEIIVQVKKDAVGDKGVTVTTEVSLSGQYVVLIPNTSVLVVSKKISDKSEKERLINIVKKGLSKDNGVIVRTDAIKVTDEIIINELIKLEELWKSIYINKNRILKNKLLYEDFSFDDMIIKEYISHVDKVILKDDEKRNVSLLEYKDKIEIYKDNYPIFESYNIESQIKESLSRDVKLHQGSVITIDETEAMTVIDVNSGKYTGSHNKEETFLQVNLAASKEIARQIRLRNISGIIIIDFINMSIPDNYKILLESLKKYFKGDKCRPKIHGVTSLGLVEITRKKDRKSLNTIMLKKCDNCSGSGYFHSDEIIFTNLISKVERILNNTNLGSLEIIVSELMNKLLLRKYSFSENLTETYLNLLERKYDISIKLVLDLSLEGFSYKTSGK